MNLSAIGRKWIFNTNLKTSSNNWISHLAPNIFSPTFYVRNLPFIVGLRKENNVIFSFLRCKWDIINSGFSFNLEYRYSLITRTKAIKSAEYHSSFKCFNDKRFCLKRPLSELIPQDEILADDAITLEVSLWVDEPEGTDFNPPREKLRQVLQITGAQGHVNNLEWLLNSGDCSDVTFLIVADSSRVKAHKALLTAQSHVFARMLATDMTEAKDNEIRIDDMGAPALKIMLRHIYTGQLGFPKGVKIDLKICQELVNAGEKYNLQVLKEYAAMAMTDFLSVENAWELLSFATRFKAKAAAKALASYYAENVDKIIEMM